MTTRTRCACCGKQVYRDGNGRVLMHTKVVVGENYGDKLRAEICEGSDRGARP